MTTENYFISGSDEHDILLKDVFESNLPRGMLDCDDLPLVDTVFSGRDDYGALMRAPLAGPAVYEYGSVISRPIAYNTPLPQVSAPYSFSRPRFRYVVSGVSQSSRFLFSLSENGVKDRLILEHLESQSIHVPYLVAAYHGLLGMSLIGAAIEASRLRDIYERASPEVTFPPPGESPYAMGDNQDLQLPASTRWLASLCAPVRFNAASPVCVHDFIPQVDDVVRWKAFRDRFRCREYQSRLPAGVSICRPSAGHDRVLPVDEKEFYASRRHPVFVTLPSGSIIMMCLNTLDGFGPDRHDASKSPLLNWAIGKLHRSGGVNTVYRHGLQRTTYALLAEECYRASQEGRRPDAPWAGGNLGAPLLPVILDYEVVHPEASSDDLFRHILSVPL